MTLNDISSLSDDELRVKVAEYLGWKSYNGVVGEPTTQPFWWKFLLLHCPWVNPNYVTIYMVAPEDQNHWRILENVSRVPDFPSDLNAMHEAEGTLTDIEAAVFEGYLYRICGVNPTTIFASETRKIYSATARQRAIAFIATKEGAEWDRSGFRSPMMDADKDHAQPKPHNPDNLSSPGEGYRFLDEDEIQNGPTLREIHIWYRDRWITDDPDGYCGWGKRDTYRTHLTREQLAKKRKEAGK